ncbi:DUF6527 family protein [Paenibacillus sp. 19GGS1-52]|uniref:DUF6527 family protein n=1 Tax=Paenibacillus sp. 19GGS1-52 TaxID=2758563 RepID=UPI001EFAB10E|nr:DUF6527 family protein [Paenibacillus sp. 19GGS1-52]
MILHRMDWDGKGTVAWRFFCPGCKQFHPIIEGRWQFNGDMERPTFSPSLIVGAGTEEVCHSFIVDGKIQFLSDCYHDLAGMTVDIPYSK